MTPKEIKIKNPITRIALFLLFAAAGAVITGALYHLPYDDILYAKIFLTSLDTDLIIYFLFSFPGMTGAIAGGLLFIFLFDREKLVYLSLNLKIFKKSFLKSIFYACAILTAGFLILLSSGTIENLIINLAFSALAMQILQYIIVSASEEILFRAYLIPAISEKTGIYLTLAITSVLFTLSHGLNPGISALPVINLLLAGILLGLIFLESRSFWPAFGFHFTWNFLEGPVLGLGVSGRFSESILSYNLNGPDLLTGGAFGFEGSILCFLGLAALIFMYFRKINIKLYTF